MLNRNTIELYRMLLNVAKSLCCTVSQSWWCDIHSLSLSNGNPNSVTWSRIFWVEIDTTIKSSGESLDECWTLICRAPQTGNCFLTTSANWGSVSDNMDCRCWNCTRGRRARWKHNVYFPTGAGVFFFTAAVHYTS